MRGSKIAIGVLAIFTILVLLSGVLSRGIARPIEALGAATRSVAAGHGDVPDPPRTAAIEIQGLYADFAAMAAAIDRRSRYLRDFAHAVSHEFKTPLAGIRGAIELLRDHGADMSEGQRVQFLANADADAGRLATLVSRLLELARADMTRGNGAATLLGPVLARVADAASGDGFAVDADAFPETQIAAPEATLETVLTALIENSRQAGATRVRLSAERSADALILRVADNGAGIAPADRARIFEPFFTTRRASGGSGLGLPIIASLLDAAGATIALADSATGATFELTLPLATSGLSPP